MKSTSEGGFASARSGPGELIIVNTLLRKYMPPRV